MNKGTYIVSDDDDDDDDVAETFAQTTITHMDMLEEAASIGCTAARLCLGLRMRLAGLGQDWRTLSRR